MPARAPRLRRRKIAPPVDRTRRRVARAAEFFALVGSTRPVGVGKRRQGNNGAAAWIRRFKARPCSGPPPAAKVPLDGDAAARFEAARKNGDKRIRRPRP